MGKHAGAPCPVEPAASLAALTTEGHALDRILDHVRGPWQARRTRLPEWNLGELVAHLARGAARVAAYLAEAPPATAEVGWLDYWRRARDLDPAAIAERSRREAAAARPEELRERFSTAWRGAVEAARVAVPGRLLPSPVGAMRLDHYLTSRVVEVTVHGLDLRAALGLEEVATPQGLVVTCAVLEGLAGGRPSDLEEDVGFVLAATGRRPHGAAGFPLLT
ncbi:MAG TPA: maleylpyruvate isomerase N-terminal domain-containing protein [Nitriliruptorales bacterium]|nr:maleylpyruvate isomerase N-terminal domain-containing protein [Nitriliruptorales bacterium]